MFMKILSKIFSPIYHQFPFFLLFIISMGYENLQNLHGKIIGDSTVTYFDIFRRFSLVVFTAYIFIVLIDVIKRKWFCMYLIVSYFLCFSSSCLFIKIFNWIYPLIFWLYWLKQIVGKVQSSLKLIYYLIIVYKLL